jgi:hypothetical protein
MLPCELAQAERSNILEAINLTLFNLNNEDMDLNLRTTGAQLFIVSAGQGTYRINSSMLSPTKNRCILGGLPVHLICLQR